MTVRFDVFVSYNSRDEPAALELCSQLAERGVRPWIAADHAVPGRSWMKQLQDVIRDMPVAIVLVGAAGIGPWEEREMEAALNEFVRRQAPVIPVLLPGAPAAPELPLFLSGLVAVNLTAENALDRLVRGIRQDVEMVKAVEQPPEERWAEVRAEIRRLLADDETAARQLAEALTSWNGAYETARSRDLATALEDAPVDEALRALNAAHHALAKDRLEKPMRTVARLAERLAPYLQVLRIEVTRDGSALLRVPVTTSTVAELVLAGVDRRAYAFCPTLGAEELPEPRGSVADFPSVGIDPKDELAFRHFVEHLLRELIPEKQRRPVDRLKPGRARDELAVKLVNGALKWRAEAPDGFRHFFLFNSDFAEQHPDFLARLRPLEELRLVELTGSEDELPNELQLCYPLADLLYRSENWRVSD